MKEEDDALINEEDVHEDKVVQLSKEGEEGGEARKDNNGESKNMASLPGDDDDDVCDFNFDEIVSTQILKSYLIVSSSVYAVDFCKKYKYYIAG